MDVYTLFFWDWDDTYLLVAHHLQNYHYDFKKQKMSIENVFLVFFKKGLAYLQYFLKNNFLFILMRDYHITH